MANLSWNEIKSRALDFQRKWENEKKENAEKQTFYNEFFEIFGVSRRRVASFEEPVKKLGDNFGFIDLFWKGVLLVEHKSFGKDLSKAKEQAMEYFPGIKEFELPRYILVSDFNDFELYDLEENKEYKFKLKELYANINLFGFMAGYKKIIYKDLEPVNMEASELMGKLYDKLLDSGYKEHDLELFLVRILFCLFADNTAIFKNEDFKYFIKDKTKEDGSDTGIWLSQLFEVLNTPEEKRQKTLDESLAAFPYINGSLFEIPVKIPSFNSDMRKSLLACCDFNWSGISPAIFGSLFQCVADKEKRRSFGEHYTSEKNIMKTISALFLDDLICEFNKIKNNKNKLKEFHEKIAKLKFLDPACGCGNFLIIAYREIRKLEIEILKILYTKNIEEEGEVFDIETMSLIDVDNFYGIEISEFPAKISEVALWLMDHLMNMELGAAFGRLFERIPLKKSAVIKNENALTYNWNNIISQKELSYILGNPPFVGARRKSAEQSAEMKTIFNNMKSYGDLDYVCAWYKKACDFIKGTKIKVAFVSTNSITQGTQVGILWKCLINKYGVHIHFAHKTFMWDNEAKGKAHVYCVIIGFACFDTDKKRLFDYEDVKGEPHEVKVENINPYLVDFKNIFINSRTEPICKVPKMKFGSMPNDCGYLLLNSKKEKNDFIKKEPNSKKFIKRFVGGEEFINNEKRYCLWLTDISPKELKKMRFVMERIKKVKEYRLNSKREATVKLADTPYLLGEIRQPKHNYLLFPRVSTSRRKYIPIGFMSKKIIAGDSCLIIENANLYYFGVLTSIMHMTWTKYVCGRLGNGYRYSKDIVYNNFPFPINPNKSVVKRIENKAQKILDIRNKYKDSSLSDLYDPLTMPADLFKAHIELDKAVDLAYGKTNLKNETERMKFIFELYESYINPLTYKK